MRCFNAVGHSQPEIPARLIRICAVAVLAACFFDVVPYERHAFASPEKVLDVQGGGDAPGRGREARRNAIANARDRLLIRHLEFWSDSSELSRLAPILDRAANYFRNVRVLRQDSVGESTHVEIEAELLASDLRTDVSKYILPTLDHKPKVVVIVQDDFGDDAARTMTDPGVAEKMIQKVLRDAGFAVIESDRLRETISPEALLACVGGAETIAAEAARSLFADAAIIGRATVSVADDSRQTNLLRNRGSIALRIVRATDDAIAEELSATGVVESQDPADGGPLAVEDACEKLADSLASGVVMAVLFSPTFEGIKLSIVGQPPEGSRDDFIEWLAVRANVDAVEIVGEDEGLLRLRLDYGGLISELVELLEGEADVRITRVLDQDVTAEFLSHRGGDLDQ